jgi:hypothetical protein
VIDLHCHLLPGVDDGAPNLSVSLTMARAADQGVTHVRSGHPRSHRLWEGGRLKPDIWPYGHVVRSQMATQTTALQTTI